jgi:ribosomal-protein-alanine N-acetyltransferase
MFLFKQKIHCFDTYQEGDFITFIAYTQTMKQLNETVFHTFPVLKTERLTLREIRLSDAEQIFHMRSSGRVNQFIARNPMKETETAVNLVQRTTDAYHTKQAIGWAGILRNSNEIIGTCGFNSIDYSNLRAEIGGELSAAYWGKHIAFEAVQAIVEFGFQEFGLHSIEAKVSPNNRGAIYLLESLGFEKEAHFKERIYFNGDFLDMAVYTAFQKQLPEI